MCCDKVSSDLYFKLPLKRRIWAAKGGFQQSVFNDIMRVFPRTASLFILSAIIFSHVGETAASNATNSSNGEDIIYVFACNYLKECHQKVYLLLSTIMCRRMAVSELRTKKNFFFFPFLLWSVYRVVLRH